MNIKNNNNNKNKNKNKLELRATYFEYFEYYVNQYLGIKKAKMFLTQLDKELKVFPEISKNECNFCKGDFMFFGITDKRFRFFSVHQKQNFLKTFNNLIFKFHVFHSDFFFKPEFNNDHELIKQYVNYFFDSFVDNYNHDLLLKNLININFSQDLALKKTVVFRILMLTFNSLEFNLSEDKKSFCFDIKDFCITFGEKLFNFCFEVFDVFKSQEDKNQYLNLILTTQTRPDIDLLKKYCKDDIVLHRSLVPMINLNLISETNNNKDLNLISEINNFYYKLGFCMFNFFVKTDSSFFFFNDTNFCTPLDVHSVKNDAFEGSKALYDLKIFNHNNRRNKISKKLLYLNLLKLDDARLEMKLGKIKFYYNYKMNLLEFDKMLKFNRANIESVNFNNFCFNFVSNESPRIYQTEYNSGLILHMFKIQKFLTKLYVQKILLHEKLFRTVILSCVVNCGIDNNGFIFKNTLKKTKNNKASNHFFLKKLEL